MAWNGVRVVLGWLGIVSEGVRGCWSGVRAAWKVLECVGMVLEWNGGCWSGLEWCWGSSSSHFLSASMAPSILCSYVKYEPCASVNFLDMKPAGLMVFQYSPWL